MNARVTIVSVTYNSSSVVRLMLSSIPDGTPVVLVDNNSKDQSELEMISIESGFKLIKNSENFGFGVGCNLGAELVETEFVFFLNPDAVLEEGALEHLVQAADKHIDTVGFNPRISWPNGTPYFKKRSHLISRDKEMPRGWPKLDAEVPVLSGAALFVRLNDFSKIGGFDPNIFLYHEDDDLSLRLIATQGKLMFVRDSKVKHLFGGSTERTPQVAAFKGWHMGRSRMYATIKHNLSYAKSKAVRDATLQLLSPFNIISKRKHSKHWAYFKGVLSVWNDV